MGENGWAIFCTANRRSPKPKSKGLTSSIVTLLNNVYTCKYTPKQDGIGLNKPTQFSWKKFLDEAHI